MPPLKHYHSQQVSLIMFLLMVFSISDGNVGPCVIEFVVEVVGRSAVIQYRKLYYSNFVCNLGSVSNIYLFIFLSARERKIADREIAGRTEANREPFTLRLIPQNH